MVGILAAGTVPAVAVAEQTSSADSSKVICQRAVATGSLVSSVFNCDTSAGWQKIGTDKDTDYREELLTAQGETAIQAIETGSAKWETLPAIKSKSPYLPYSQFVKQVYDMLRKGDCKLAGQKPRAFDIVVPYAVQIQPDGKATRVLVSEIGCDPIEALVGSIAVARAGRGDFLPTGDSQPRWYKDSINFTLR